MKIIVKHNDCKFINNIDSLSENHDIIYVNINNNIYQIEQKINPDAYILSAEKLTDEELHFCQNIKSKKVFVYQQSTEKISIENATFLYDSELPVLYNKLRFNNQNVHKDIEYSYFLDNDSNISEKLSKRLLPNKSYKIKLFNNSKISHPQNLGLLSENDKSIILNRTQNYICNNMFYAIEAKLCGCRVLDLDFNDIDINIDNYKTYSNFFGDLL